jgi:hypothetical protein
MSEKEIKTRETRFLNMPVKENTLKSIIALKASDSQSYDDVVNRLIEVAPKDLWSKET